MAGALVVALIREPLSQAEALVDGCGGYGRQAAVFGRVGAGVGEGFLGASLEVAPSGPGGGRRSGVDADLGEEALLFGMEGRVAGALQVQPFAQAVAGGGKAAGGLERASGFGVIAGLVPGALPQGAPWRVPPRVQRVEGGPLLYAELDNAVMALSQRDEQQGRTDLGSTVKLRITITGDL